MQKLIAILRQFSLAADKEGRGTVMLFLEWLRLRMGPGKMGISEYFEFHLYEPGPFERKLEFMGYRTERPLDELLNKGSWIATVYDKLTFDTLMRAANKPVPEIYCLYRSVNRHHYSNSSYSKPLELSDFIVNDMPTPCFVKPVLGSFGKGCFIVDETDRETGTVSIANSGPLEVSDFIDLLDSHLDSMDPRRARNGYLFQECLLPHTKIEEVVGPRISGVRVIVLKLGDKTKIVSGVWKITTGTNIVDNFNKGSEGNWFASVNLKNGKVGRVIKRTGLSEQTLSESDPEYPMLQDFYLPDWSEICQLCISASALFPRLWFQHWDIAITNRGPVAMECNTWGGLHQTQVASRRGIYTEEFGSAIEMAKTSL